MIVTELYKTLRNGVKLVKTYSNINVSYNHSQNDADSESAENAAKNKADNKPKANKKSPSRNDPCPCGSGKKYKHCCGKLK